MAQHIRPPPPLWYPGESTYNRTPAWTACSQRWRRSSFWWCQTPRGERKPVGLHDGSPAMRQPRTQTLSTPEDSTAKGLCCPPPLAGSAGPGTGREETREISVSEHPPPPAPYVTFCRAAVSVHDPFFPSRAASSQCCGYTSRLVGTHQGLWVHIKACGYTSRPEVHIKACGCVPTGLDVDPQALMFTHGP